MKKPKPVAKQEQDYRENKHGILVGKGGVTGAGFHNIEPFLRCPKEYQLKNVRHITPIATETKEAFAVGLFVHAGRGVWFARQFSTTSKTWTKIQEAIALEVEKMKLPSNVGAEQQALRYLTEYIEHYSKLPKPTPKAVEHLVEAKIDPSHPFWGVRTARLDDVSEYEEAGGGLALGEAKTTTASLTEITKVYELHGQPLLQHLVYRAAATGQALLGEAVGTVLDVIQKGGMKAGRPVKSKFHRVFIPVPAFPVEWLSRSLPGYLKAASMVDWNTEVPRNPTQCTRVAGGHLFSCDYKDLCRFGRSACGKYTMPSEDGKPGQSLLSWKPSPGRKVEPWS